MSDQQLQPQNGPMGLASKGAILGLVIAYPVSYFFQSAILRDKLSLGEYISNINKVLSDDKLVTADRNRGLRVVDVQQAAHGLAHLRNPKTGEFSSGSFH